MSGGVTMKQTYITTSWDDGHQLDLRVAELLTKYRLHGTFYIPKATENGTMKAAAYFEYGEPEVLQYVDLPRPTPGPGEVLVRVRAVSINAFDLMARAGRYTPNKGVFPHVLGSDISGEIAEIGPDVREPLQVGQRITAWWVVPCGRCEQCITGNPNICALDYKYLGAHLWGGYAQYLKLPAFNVIPLPESVSWE